LPSFTVLHVCVGNICRSPMAERLFTLALREQVGDRVDDLYLSHGAGTGAWHIGESMNPPAARQVTKRGGDPSGFRARKISGDLIDMSDLVLCATAEQVSYVLGLRPDAQARTFVLGEFGRLLNNVKLPVLADAVDNDSAYARGVALVEAVDTARGGDIDEREPSRRSDDLDDPWGMADSEFARVADEIERTVVPLAVALTR
jgi:low molecular weight protein-tyrosine phosphatase